MKRSFPATWNWLPDAVTAGAATPPRAPVKVCRFDPLAAAVEEAAAAEATADEVTAAF